ncbi:MAG: hypothetical protein NC122_05005 [Faecalibacterium sp.]|nr:hypothetical protein [Ruminococcus sp.]MCM1391880.1 hypothetical protein [Ruminococcus sp.]MCM1485544.1 hypothetical protein [Faecalibacterium sp.]
MKTPTATEIAVAKAIEAERLRLLMTAKECKDLDEFVKYLEKLTKA